jgi:hypothetical protein
MLLPFRDHKKGNANPLVWTAANLSDLHTRPSVELIPDLHFEGCPSSKHISKVVLLQSTFRRLSFFKAHHDLTFVPPISNQPSSRIITRLFPLTEGKASSSVLRAGVAV